MLPAQAGCPHDYALTPQDMSKLAQADILVLNGLGLEAFLGSPSARAQKELHTIDSSKGISGCSRIRTRKRRTRSMRGTIMGG